MRNKAYACLEPDENTGGIHFAKWPMLDGKIEEDKTILCVSATVPPEISMLLVKRLKIIGSL